MKTLIIVLFTILAAQAISAQPTIQPAEKRSIIADNLTLGIKSDNTGLHTSSALVLFDLIRDNYLERGDAYKAMIPLLNILQEGKTEEERIAAAVALYELGNPIGIYRLRGVAVYDKNEKVSTVCKNLYVSYHKLHGTEYLISL